MIEKTIYLDEIDLVAFYGVNNIRFERVRKHFPKLSLIARGNEIKISGTSKAIEEFEIRFGLFISHLNQYNDISDDLLDKIMSEDLVPLAENSVQDFDVLLYGESGKPIRAQTINQKKLVEECLRNDLLLAIGPAGTGKTYTAIALAVKALKMREIKKIILTRPAVEAGERLGFLPGDFKEKLDPYLQPLYDALDDMIPSRKLKAFMEEGTIQIAPLAYMRGRTLDHAFVILDEAQNATGNQLKMFLTRMGKNAKFIVTGDITQIDLPRKSDSGLIIAEKILAGIEGISIIHFDDRDIIRHKLVKYIVDAYAALEEVKETPK
jgi:phosphate starvation-inducible protein PhoH and related proteins